MLRGLAAAAVLTTLLVGCSGDPSESNTADVPGERLGDLLEPQTTDEPVTVTEACVRYREGAGPTLLQTLANRLDTPDVAYEFADLAAALRERTQAQRRDAPATAFIPIERAIRAERADVNQTCAR